MHEITIVAMAHIASRVVNECEETQERRNTRVCMKADDCQTEPK